MGRILIAFLCFGLSVGKAFATEDSAFVQRIGSQLSLEGKSYYFSGANQYYLFYQSQKMVDEVLEDAAAMGLDTVRTWAFADGNSNPAIALQPEAGVYNEEAFRRLDYAVYKAKQLGIKLILSLVNNWDDFGGMNAYVRWSPTARSHDDFYSDATTRALFKKYINNLLWRTNYYTKTRYKDEPAILMWELANEPRVESYRAQDLYAWIHEMAGYIKSIDPQHLVTTGSEGDIATDFVAVHKSPHIDIASIHLYPEHWNLSDAAAREYIRRHTALARNVLNKPIFSGEMGIRDLNRRDEIYRSWYEEFDAADVNGALVWILSAHRDDGSLYPDYDGFTIYYPESWSTVRIIEDFSRKLRAKSNQNFDWNNLLQEQAVSGH